LGNEVRYIPSIPKGAKLALLSAILFGISTPLTKIFLENSSPFITAGLLYLSSGISIGLYRQFKKPTNFNLPLSEKVYFGSAILCGGIAAPVLLLIGLSQLEASTASILLNLEGVFTALLAWFIFKENFDRRILIGMLSIVTGAGIVGWNGSFDFRVLPSMLLIVAACLFWALDNNLTRNVISADITWMASTKGLVAGVTNLFIATQLGDSFPKLGALLAITLIGVFSFGVSLVLFIGAMRTVGTSRAGAYFSVAPFFGALAAVILGDPLTAQLGIAAIFMGFGIYLHITENHHHEHSHDGENHAHAHFPDINHRHH
jgi:hypothetical protein